MTHATGSLMTLVSSALRPTSASSLRALPVDTSLSEENGRRNAAAVSPVTLASFSLRLTSASRLRPLPVDTSLSEEKR